MVYIHVCSIDKVLPAVARLKTVRIIEHLLNGLVVPKKNRVRLVLKDEYDLFFTTKNFFPPLFLFNTTCPGTFFLGFFLDTEVRMP